MNLLYGRTVKPTEKSINNFESFVAYIFIELFLVVKSIQSKSKLVGTFEPQSDDDFLFVKS